MAGTEAVALYLCRIDGFLGLSGEGLLGARRASAMRAFKKPEDRARCLVGGLLLRRVFGVAADAEMRYNGHGKPYLPAGSRYFSLSHSGAYVALAVAEDEIGVDVEVIAPYTAAVAKRVFTAPELDWLAHRRGDAAFYTLWTAKESVMKGTGLGFALPPERFTVLPVATGAHVIEGREWHFRWLCREGHMVCIAAPRQPSVTVTTLARDDFLL